MDINEHKRARRNETSKLKVRSTRGSFDKKKNRESIFYYFNFFRFFSEKTKNLHKVLFYEAEVSENE